MLIIGYVNCTISFVWFLHNIIETCMDMNRADWGLKCVFRIGFIDLSRNYTQWCTKLVHSTHPCVPLNTKTKSVPLDILAFVEPIQYRTTNATIWFNCNPDGFNEFCTVWTIPFTAYIELTITVIIQIVCQLSNFCQHV